MIHMQHMSAEEQEHLRERVTQLRERRRNNDRSGDEERARANQEECNEYVHAFIAEKQQRS